MGKHTPLDEQQALVEAWRQSGQSPLVFASAHGLRVGTLRSWIARHAPIEPGEAVTFLEVLFVPVQAPVLFPLHECHMSPPRRQPGGLARRCPHRRRGTQTLR